MPSGKAGKHLVWEGGSGMYCSQGIIYPCCGECKWGLQGTPTRVRTAGAGRVMGRFLGQEAAVVVPGSASITPPAQSWAKTGSS